ncbi:putative Nucleosome assembly protein (NAP) [Monocercomonoides exilis]|uniref:putative Nucleosome assembly protein (NAP) n=1 Tax=Monocercomonoides exilis TaxID=2049356 RepID=UPI003559B198|nr:putative Nucleosome assembly protein (NAP) [Monocercomonoides exilis]|eukprot:MONOS_14683.1-p1 / transcript=MONOS_14683.1 / gene=MONOS_14683 / organism=Monocercomonoides_exilis_PA203 / gene_product=unspecified product / transcript_product=unspecified product / location=Mono_scaffold01050:11600-13175(+) / protein_length=492 / sequence_SO=supercontig / SO=protein_coding / is_pseudo=false
MSSASCSSTGVDIPDNIHKRLRALKKIQDELSGPEANYEKEKAEILSKYSKIFENIFETRKKIITGEYEPKEEELAPVESLPFAKPEDGKDEPSSSSSASEKEESDKVKGVHGFWKQCIRGAPMFNNVIHMRDLDALEYLSDIHFEKELRSDDGAEEDEDEEDEKSEKEEESKEKDDQTNQKSAPRECETVSVVFVFEKNPYFKNESFSLTFRTIKEGSRWNYSYLPPEVEEGKQSIEWKKGMEIGVFQQKVMVDKKVKDSKGKSKGKGKGKEKKIKVEEEITVVRPTFFDMFLSFEEYVEKMDTMQDAADKYKISAESIKEEEKIWKKKGYPFLPEMNSESGEKKGKGKDKGKKKQKPGKLEVDEEDEKEGIYEMEADKDKEVIESDVSEMMSSYLMIGLFLVNELLPNAIGWFTGEAVVEMEKNEEEESDDDDDDDDSDEDEDEDEEEEDEDEEDDEDDDDSDDDNAKDKKSKAKAKGAEKELPPECKQS